MVEKASIAEPAIPPSIREELTREAVDTNRLADTLRDGTMAAIIHGTPAGLAAYRLGIEIKEKEE